VRTNTCTLADCETQTEENQIGYFYLHLKTNSDDSDELSSLERDELVKHLADVLGVNKNDITLIEEGQQRRRLATSSSATPVADEASSAHGRMLPASRLKVIIKGGLAGGADLDELETRLNNGAFVTHLRDGPGFDDLQEAHFQAHDEDYKAPGDEMAPTPPPTSAAVSLPDSETSKIMIIIGLKAVEPRGGSGRYLGKPVYDTGFDLGRRSAQIALENVCRRVLDAKPSLAVREAKCIVDDLKIYLNTLKKPAYPVTPAEDVHGYLKDILRLKQGLEYRQLIGFHDDSSKVAWIALEFSTNLPRTMSAEDAWVYRDRWDEFIDGINSEEDKSHIGTIFHTCELWVRAETELRLVRTTLMCAACSVCFAFIAVVIFLGDLALAVYLILNIVCVVISLAALMFGIFGWPFGAVEAVCLIVFVGFSVDYGLHVAEAYSLSTENERAAKTRDALRRTGGAVTAAAITSICSGLPLLFCTIQVFMKFGALIVSNCTLAYLYSMTFFIALISIAGPVEPINPCQILFTLCCGRGKVAEPSTSDQAGDAAVPGQVVGYGRPAGSRTHDDYKYDYGEENKEVEKAKGGSSSNKQTI
jgi:hypothetical protein